MWYNIFDVSIKDLSTILPPIVLLALILSFAPELCQPALTNQPSIMGNNQSFDPFCYLKTISPEQPELKIPNPVDGLMGITSFSASANASGTSQYYSFSPSLEAPEES